MTINTQLIFNSIACRYELVNTLISFGLWKLWNRILVQKFIYPNNLKNREFSDAEAPRFDFEKSSLLYDIGADFSESKMGASVKEKTDFSGYLGIYPNERILDLCSGTGIVPKTLLTHLRKQNKILPFIDCIDLSPHMIEIARKNLTMFEPFVSFIQADVTHIPQTDSFYDAVILAYGLRNIPLLQSIQEIKRVLKPGGMLFALELTQPSSSFLRILHSVYFSTWARFIGFMATHNKEAYSYLLRSIQAFSLPQTIRTLQEEGFTDIITHQIMCGCVTFITAKKK
jgi:ubiquinone/menaquinone biosynthesis methyltransferase